MFDLRAAVAMAAAVLSVTNTAWGIDIQFDQPILGNRLQLRTAPSGRQKLVFRSTDPLFLQPTPGNETDPMTYGLVVELLSPAGPMASMTAPATGADPGWTLVKGTYKFKRGKTPATVTPIKTVVFKRGRKLMITADATGLPMTAPLEKVGIRVRTGTMRNCAFFSDASVLQDIPGKFSGKNAPPPTDCSSTTMTGQPPVCGDGEVNPLTEQCDGSDRSLCGPFATDCRLPGAVGECGCCSHGGAFAAQVGCCNPSSRVISFGSNSASCEATRCDPPYGCDGTDQCQADGSCCTILGGTCELAYPIAAELNPCCPGLECQAPATDGFSFWIECCTPETGACTTDADCCTRHCEGDGTCGPCGAAGTACTAFRDCCSRSCNASTSQCDP